MEPDTMTPNRFYLLAAFDLAGETAEGPYSKAEADIRATADPSLKIVTEAQLDARCARPRPDRRGYTILNAKSMTTLSELITADFPPSRTKAFDAAVIRFTRLSDDAQVAELARAERAIAALPDTTRPALRAYFRAAVDALQACHDMRPPIREVVLKGLRDELNDRLLADLFKDATVA